MNAISISTHINVHWTFLHLGHGCIITLEAKITVIGDNFLKWPYIAGWVCNAWQSHTIIKCNGLFNIYWDVCVWPLRWLMIREIVKWLTLVYHILWLHSKYRFCDTGHFLGNIANAAHNTRPKEMHVCPWILWLFRVGQGLRNSIFFIVVTIHKFLNPSIGVIFSHRPPLGLVKFSENPLRHLSVWTL